MFRILGLYRYIDNLYFKSVIILHSKHELLLGSWPTIGSHESTSNIRFRGILFMVFSHDNLFNLKHRVS